MTRELAFFEIRSDPNLSDPNPIGSENSNGLFKIALLLMYPNYMEP